ncbi:MAG TPA: hypothetical protein VFU21_02135 [Kofleriaceae bacterium]|nr:hypothetical protein [Kofleriaceae bacterium]
MQVGEEERRPPGRLDAEVGQGQRLVELALAGEQLGQPGAGVEHHVLGLGRPLGEADRQDLLERLDRLVALHLRQVDVRLVVQILGHRQGEHQLFTQRIARLRDLRDAPGLLLALVPLVLGTAGEKRRRHDHQVDPPHRSTSWGSARRNTRSR